MSDRVQLRVTAPRGTEVRLVNSSLRTQGFDVGGLSAEVVPGTYKLVSRLGASREERLVDIGAGTPVIDIALGGQPYRSAAPGPWGSMSHEYHADFARDLSHSPAIDRGHGGEILLVLRNWSRPEAKPAPTPTNPMAKLSICRADGTELLDCGSAATSPPNAPDPIYGLKVAVDPGAYRLRMCTEVSGELEQSLIVPVGWQLQMFLLQTDVDPGPAMEWGADLLNATISLARIEAGYAPWDAPGGAASANATALGELARQALARGNPVLKMGELRDLLHEKFANPMLGILGAHALLQCSPTNATLMHEVLDNLRDLLGPHPDVDALAVAAGVAPSEPALPGVPPMLVASWQKLVERAAEDERWMPEGSLAASIADRLWGDGAWLLWRAEASVSGQLSPLDHGQLMESAAEGSQIAEFTMGDVAYAPAPEDLTELELVVYRLADRWRTRVATTEHPSSGDILTGLARELRLPKATVSSALGRARMKRG